MLLPVQILVAAKHPPRTVVCDLSLANLVAVSLPRGGTSRARGCLLLLAEA